MPDEGDPALAQQAGERAARARRRLASAHPHGPQAGSSKLRVAHGVADVAVPQELLDETGVRARVGQHVAGAVPQHVGVGVEADVSLPGGARDDAGDHVRAQHAAPLRDEHERAGAVLLQLAQASHLIAVQRMALSLLPLTRKIWMVLSRGASRST